MRLFFLFEFRSLVDKVQVSHMDNENKGKRKVHGGGGGGVWGATITNCSPSQTARESGNRQNQTSANQTNVRKALRLALPSPSEVIAMLKGLKNTRTK